MNPVLFTERLVLRLPESGDLDAWAEFSADPNTMRYLGGTQSRAESWRGLCAMRGAWDIRGFGMFSVTERETGRWVGRIGPWEPEGWPGREIGWGVAREFAGRGYAYEAACATMDFAFDVLGSFCQPRARLDRLTLGDVGRWMQGEARQLGVDPLQLSE